MSEVPNTAKKSDIWYIKLLIFLGGGVRPCPLVLRPQLAHCTSPRWHTREMEHLMNNEACLNANLSITNTTLTDLGLNQAATVRSWQLMSWAMAQPYCQKLVRKNGKNEKKGNNWKRKERSSVLLTRAYCRNRCLFHVVLNEDHLFLKKKQKYIKLGWYTIYTRNCKLW